MRQVIHSIPHSFKGALAACVAAVMGIVMWANEARAASIYEPRPIDPLAQQFAYCAGRASAEFDEDFGNQDLRAVKDHFTTLLEAMIHPAEQERYDAYRIAAKVAQMDLLHTARFSFRQEASDRARSIAQTEIANCRRLILGG